MAKTYQGGMAYTVVEVWRGIASAVHVFHALKDAEAFYRRLHAEHNSHQEDVQLFKTRVR